MSRPIVSVVIATYNSGTYLKDAIESVLKQSMPELELLVIDDGSTDGTRALVQSFSDKRLRYIWQSNAGQTSAKNHGIREATGEFIGFCDGDDYWYPDKLELQLPMFSKSPDVGVVYSATDIIDERGTFIEKSKLALHRGNVTDRLFMTNFVPFGTAIVRRKCIEEHGAFDEQLRMGIDWDLWLRISANYLFDFVPESTYAYRIWSGQMSKNWRGRYSSAFLIMDKFIRANPGLISGKLRRRAMADTYANRARARSDEQPLQAILDSANAILLSPLQPYSWKTLGRTVRDSIIPVDHAPLGSDHHENHQIAKKVLAPLTRRLTRRSPRIFLYHRFSTAPERRAFAATEFRRQMELLKERCEVLTFSELLDRRDTRSRKPFAAITVDDGYADFHQIAFPILRDLGLPATVFVTTGFVDRQLYLWPDQIRALLYACPAGTYRLGGFWRNAEVTLRRPEDRERAWHYLADQLVFVPTATRSSALRDLSASIGVPADSLDMSAYAAMTWEQLRELHAGGIEVADHSYSHGCLTAHTDAELDSDLAMSKELLEGKLDTRVRSFAYPNGTRRDYDERVLHTLRRLGYEFAALSIPQQFSRNRPLELGRFHGACSYRRFRNLISGYGVLREHIRSTG